MKIQICPFCQEKLKIKKLECIKCGVSYEGEFYTSPLMKLSEDQQNFVELFVLSSGSLKEMAEILGVTYPTVRSRLDEVIGELKEQMKQTKDYKKHILEKVDKGEIAPEKAAQIIRNL